MLPTNVLMPMTELARIFFLADSCSDLIGADILALLGLFLFCYFRGLGKS